MTITGTPRHEHRSKTAAKQHLSADETEAAMRRRAADRPECAHYAHCLGKAARVHIFRGTRAPTAVCPLACDRFEVIAVDRPSVSLGCALADAWEQ